MLKLVMPYSATLKKVRKILNPNLNHLQINWSPNLINLFCPRSCCFRNFMNAYQWLFQ